jgi:hypothetical protein
MELSPCIIPPHPLPGVLHPPANFPPIFFFVLPLASDSVYCRKIQGTAERFRALQKDSGYCRKIQGTAERFSVLKKDSVYCRNVQCTAERFSVLQKDSVYCRKIQCTTEIFSVLQKVKIFKGLSHLLKLIADKNSTMDEQYYPKCERRNLYTWC